MEETKAKWRNTDLIAFQSPLDAVRSVYEEESNGYAEMIHTEADAAQMLLPEADVADSHSVSKWLQPVWKHHPDITYKDMVRILWVLERIAGDEDNIHAKVTPTRGFDLCTTTRAVDIFLSIMADPSVKVNLHTLGLLSIVCLTISVRNDYDDVDYYTTMRAHRKYYQQVYEPRLYRRIRNIVLRYQFDICPPIGQSDIINQSLCKSMKVESRPPIDAPLDAGQLSHTLYAYIQTAILRHYYFPIYPPRNQRDHAVELLFMNQLDLLLKGRTELQISVAARYLRYVASPLSNLDDGPDFTKVRELDEDAEGGALPGYVLARPQTDPLQVLDFWDVAVFNNGRNEAITEAPGNLAQEVRNIVKTEKEIKESKNSDDEGVEDGPQLFRPTVSKLPIRSCDTPR